MTRVRPPADRFDGSRVARAVGGLLLGGLLLVGYLVLVGIGDVRRALWAVPPRNLLSLLLVGVVPLLFWGLGLALVLHRLGRRVSAPTAVLLFSTSAFLNAVTPFGQAGGDPVTAVLLRRAVGTDFESGLAAIGSVNALNRVAVVFLGLLGVGYFGASVAAGGALRDAVVLVAGLSAVGAIVLVLAWLYRRTLIRVFAAALSSMGRALTRVVPVGPTPSRRAIERRGYRFVDAIDRLASDPARLGAVFGLSVSGHLAVAATLWVALDALGFDASLAVILLVLPIAKLAGLAPTPGGFGTAEALLVALLVPTTGVDAAVAGAAVLLYRAGAFWIPSLLGGLVVGWILGVGPVGGAADDRRRPGADDREGAAPPDRDHTLATGRPSTLPPLLLALAVSLALLAALVLHRRHLVSEPPDLAVHVIRDAALVVLSFVLTWAGLRQLLRLGS